MKNTLLTHKTTKTQVTLRLGAQGEGDLQPISPAPPPSQLFANLDLLGIEK